MLCILISSRSFRSASYSACCLEALCIAASFSCSDFAPPLDTATYDLSISLSLAVTPSNISATLSASRSISESAFSKADCFSRSTISSCRAPLYASLKISSSEKCLSRAASVFAFSAFSASIFSRLIFNCSAFSSIFLSEESIPCASGLLEPPVIAPCVENMSPSRVTILNAKRYLFAIAVAFASVSTISVLPRRFEITFSNSLS